MSLKINESLFAYIDSNILSKLFLKTNLEKISSAIFSINIWEYFNAYNVSGIREIEVHVLDGQFLEFVILSLTVSTSNYTKEKLYK